MPEFLKWIAQNFGAKYPYLSTGLAMLLAAVFWQVFVQFATRSVSTSSQPQITQTSKDAPCSNIVVTGGSASANCSTGEEGTDDAEKKGAGEKKDH